MVSKDEAAERMNANKSDYQSGIDSISQAKRQNTLGYGLSKDLEMEWNGDMESIYPENHQQHRLLP